MIWIIHFHDVSLQNHLLYWWFVRMWYKSKLNLSRINQSVCYVKLSRKPSVYSNLLLYSLSNLHRRKLSIDNE